MQRRPPTLKEKLNEHYQKRDFKAKKTQASNIGMVFFGVMLVTLCIESLIFLLPNYYFNEETGKYNRGYRVMQVLSVILFMETLANWWHSYYDVINRVTKGLKEHHYPNMSETPPGWKNCPTCMIDAPPRSHHCTLCNHCILKRDHHCFFTGSCIGHYNQRSFVIFCLYAVIGSGLAAYYQLSYLNKDYSVFSSAAIFYFPFYALWQLLNGLTSITHVIILIHAYATIFSFGLSAFFLGWHITIISRGMTSYEAWKQITLYQRKTIYDNFMVTFGSPAHFLICLFIPMTILLPDEGVKWEIEAKAQKGH